MTGTNRAGMQTEPLLISPVSGSDGALRSPSFSWTGLPYTDLYQFTLARDAELRQIVVQEEVPNSAYLYEGELEWGETYFWQVQVIAPIPSEPSEIGVFTVGVPIQQQELPEYAPYPIPDVDRATPTWVWWIIGVLTALNVVVITFVMVRR